MNDQKTECRNFSADLDVETFYAPQGFEEHKLINIAWYDAPFFSIPEKKNIVLTE